jgi:hypothetical protein
MESDHVPPVSPKSKKRRNTDDVDDPPHCPVIKTVTIPQAEERSVAVGRNHHKSNSEEDESGVWVVTVEGETHPYYVRLKMMSLQTTHCFTKEHGWLPLLQLHGSESTLLGCHTCFKATIITSMYNHAPGCVVKCRKNPTMMEKLEKTQKIKKDDQRRRMENPEKKLANLVKTKQHLTKSHNPFGSKKPKGNFHLVSVIF